MAPRKSTGEAARIRKLAALLNKERWTSKAPLAVDVPLTIAVHRHHHHHHQAAHRSRDALIKELTKECHLPDYIEIKFLENDMEEDDSSGDSSAE